MPVPGCVPIRGVAATQVVPWRRLVPAPRGEPRGPGDQDRPAGLRDSHHLRRHGLRLRDVLQNVAGVGEVEAGVGKRQPQARRPHGVRTHLTAGRELADIGVGTGVCGSGCTESLGEVPRTATDVKHHRAPQVAPSRSLADRVGGEQGVEPVGICLLGTKRPEQGNRAAQRPNRWESRGRGPRPVQHVALLTHFRTLTPLLCGNNRIRPGTGGTRAYRHPELA